MQEQAGQTPPDDTAAEQLVRERLDVLHRIEDMLEMPMVILGLAWLVLLVVELVRGVSPFLEGVGIVIWAIFVLHFLLEFTLAPRKWAYLKSNWLTAIALLVPALRVLRTLRALSVLRAARAARGVRLVRVVTSVNRGMGVLRRTLGRRGFGYVMALTALVTVSGAAGMYAFENDAAAGGGLQSYGVALWWTAMLMTSIGSDYWPQSAEGRLLCFFLSIYSLAVFGYITATIATFFIGRDAMSEEAELANARSVQELRDEVRALRVAVEALAQRTQR